MKTVYTDKYGLYPWAMLIVAGGMFWTASDGYLERNGSKLGLGLAAGAVFLIMAVKRFRDIRHAKLEGRDHTILRTTNADD